MIKRILALLLLGCMLLPTVALANDQKVVDLAELFTVEQETALNQQLGDLSAKLGGLYDLVVVTTNDTGGKSSMTFADDYYDANGYGYGDNHSGALLLVDMDNGDVYISTTGLAIKEMDDTEVEKVLDAMYNGAVDGDFYRAASDGLKATYKGLKVPGLLDYFPPTVLLVALALALAGGCIAVVAVKGSYSAKKAPDNYPLTSNSQLQLRQQHDVFLHKTVTRTKIERSSSSGGGGGGSSHSGSSGRSHGGGGRSFR